MIKTEFRKQKKAAKSCERFWRFGKSEVMCSCRCIYSTFQETCLWVKQDSRRASFFTSSMLAFENIFACKDSRKLVHFLNDVWRGMTREYLRHSLKKRWKISEKDNQANDQAEWGGANGGAPFSGDEQGRKHRRKGSGDIYKRAVLIDVRHLIRSIRRFVTQGFWDDVKVTEKELCSNEWRKIVMRMQNRAAEACTILSAHNENNFSKCEVVLDICDGYVGIFKRWLRRAMSTQQSHRCVWTNNRSEQTLRRS